MTTVEKAVTIKETVEGGFYVMFGDEAVGFHLSRPSAERNRNRFLLALNTYLSAFHPLLKRMWDAVELDHLLTIDAYEAYQEAKQIAGMKDDNPQQEA